MKYLFLLAVLVTVGCGNEDDLLNPSSSSSIFGKYQGTVSAGPLPSYDMLVEIVESSGDADFIFVFGNRTTEANLSGSKFTLVPTEFTGIRTSGSGSFGNNSMEVKYSEELTAGGTVVTYEGTLSKL